MTEPMTKRMTRRMNKSQKPKPNYRGSHHYSKNVTVNGYTHLPKTEKVKSYKDYVIEQEEKGEIDSFERAVTLNKNRGGTDYGVMDWKTMRLAPPGSEGGWKRTGHSRLFHNNKRPILSREN